MITAMFLMLFSLAMYIEWGIKEDQKERRRKSKQRILMLNSKNKYLLANEKVI